MEIDIGKIIIENKIYLGNLDLDVEKSKPNVGDKSITDNGVYNAKDDRLDGYDIVTVDVKPLLGIKEITKNGIYKAIDDNLDGYSEVNVETSGADVNDYFNDTTDRLITTMLKKIPMVTIVGSSTNYMFQSCTRLTTIPKLDTSNITTMEAMFDDCSALVIVPLIDTSNVTKMAHMFNDCTALTTIPLFNTSNVVDMQSMFSGCTSLNEVPELDLSSGPQMHNMFRGCTALTTIPQFDTSKVQSIFSMFYGCTALTNVPELDMSSAISIDSVFYNCKALTDFGGFLNLGKGYLTSQSANYNSYTLTLSSCTKLTRDSLLNVVNNLYDIKTAGVKAQKLVLGFTLRIKLGSEGIAIATNKGWTVS